MHPYTQHMTTKFQQSDTQAKTLPEWRELLRSPKGHLFDLDDLEQFLNHTSKIYEEFAVVNLLKHHKDFLVSHGVLVLQNRVSETTKPGTLSYLVRRKIHNIMTWIRG